MDDSNACAVNLTAAPGQLPLQGLTVLVVEDSRFASDAMRMLCLRSGARIRRADRLAAARRHLKTYRPSVLVVDLGLPDGSGLDLIAEAAAAVPRIRVILGTSGDPAAEAAVMAAGADGFLPKPVTSLHRFQEAILAHAAPGRAAAATPDRTHIDNPVEPDPLAYLDDMLQAAEILCESTDEAMLDYVAQFLAGVARIADDAALAEAASELARIRASGGPAASGTARVAGLVQERLRNRGSML